jgi:hypothetical protein
MIFTCPGCGVLFPSRGSYMCHARYDRSCTRETRMWAQIDKNGPNGCWIWTGMVNSWGYGAMNLGNGRRMAAVHRVIYQRHIGKELPASAFCLHRCDTPRCVNPEHIFLGDHAENMADMVRKDRHTRGARNHTARLTDAQVIEIRRSYSGAWGEITRLAEVYGVSEAAMRAVIRGASWKHLNAPSTRISKSSGDPHS